MTATYDQLQEARASIQSAIGDRKPKIGLILGSGLGAYAETLEDAVAVEYGDIPNFPVSTVEGHAGRLLVGNKGGVTCAAMQGRVHFYEGHDARTLVFPARTLITLGVDTLIITNAAGGIEHDPGTLMVITDHLNLFPDNPLRGINDDRIGARFPDMTTAYTPELQAVAHAAAKKIGQTLGEGVYAGLPGPSYETPAEIRMLRTMGASAAGMSTVPEVIAANHMGARVLGISCITNKAAGLSGRPLSHDEVTETAQDVHETFISLLDQVIADLSAA
jgi:purine-nucleoside phosphorylase